MKVFNNLEELRDAPYPIYVHVRKCIKNNASLAEIRRDMVKRNFGPDQAFDYYLGGKPVILETISELSNLTTDEENPATGEWYHILEKSSPFDVVDELEGGWTAFTILGNNSGGNIYFVPDWMKEHCPNIQESIDLSNETEHGSEDPSEQP